MTPKELRERFPRLFLCLEELALDNEMKFRNDVDLSSIPPESLYELEGQANRLDNDEIAVMAAGEESERESLIKAKSVEALDGFLASAFENELHDKIFK